MSELGDWQTDGRIGFLQYYVDDDDASSAAFPPSVQHFYGLGKDTGIIKDGTCIGVWPIHTVAQLLDEEDVETAEGNYEDDQFNLTSLNDAGLDFTSIAILILDNNIVLMEGYDIG